ncbi:MAG: hypothetical protein R2739_09760 [Chitinophagales bacterium]
MHKSKYFELLMTLTKKQLVEVEQYFVTHNDKLSLDLFAYISSFLIKKINERKLSRAYIIEKVFKNKIDEKKLQKLLNEGVRVCEWIIIQTVIQQDNAQQYYILANHYQQKSLDKYFKQQIQLLNEALNATQESSSKYYMLHQLEHLTIQHELNYNQRYSNYSKLHEFLQTHYEIESKKIKCLSQINLRNTLVEEPLNNNLSFIYKELYSLILQNEETDYLSLWEKFRSISSTISPDDLRTISVVFVNICIGKINTNHSDFYEHLLNVYIFLLDNNLAFEASGNLLPAFYKNVITISLRLNKLDYAVQFAENFKNYLPQEEREDVYAYNLAHIYFYQNKFDEVLKLLASSKFIDVFFKLSSRVLQIKTLAELVLQDEAYNNVLDSNLNAFKKYIYTNTDINESYTANYKNFYRMMVKVISSNKEDFPTTQNEIQQTKPLTEVEWMLSFHKRWNEL